MKKNIVVIFLILMILCLGCSKDEQTDAMKFKGEYEKYNGELIELNIDEENIIKYVSREEVNKIIKSKTGVIFIGDPSDNLSRVAINLLLEASSSTDLSKIYYIDRLDNIEGLEKIENKKVPLVLNVLDGEVKSYHVGTIEDKDKLTEDEKMELYNIYIEGIHEVLQDSCDERC